jgi:hypothetical protein
VLCVCLGYQMDGRKSLRLVRRRSVGEVVCGESEWGIQKERAKGSDFLYSRTVELRAMTLGPECERP